MIISFTSRLAEMWNKKRAEHAFGIDSKHGHMVQYLATKLSHYSTWLLNGLYIWKVSVNL